jgi:hypothetical protein
MVWPGCRAWMRHGGVSSSNPCAHLLRTLLALAALGDTLVPLRSAWIELAWSFHGEDELLGRACLHKSALSLVRRFQAMPWSG